MKFTPLPHQIQKSREALAIIKELGICLIQGEPRSGKTLTSILVAEELIDVSRVLVLTKKNAIAIAKKVAKTKDYSEASQNSYEVTANGKGSKSIDEK